MLRMVRPLALVVLAFVVAGCGPEDPKSYGEQLFSDRALSTAPSNIFTCATCHDTIANPTKLRPGYSLYDVVSRPSWWGGNVLTLLDAVNQCVTNFMRGALLDPADPKSRSLLVYLESISPDKASPALPLTVVQNIVDVPSGNPAAGKVLWDEGCANCHGAPHTGIGRIAPSVSLVPDDSIAAHGTNPKTGARPVVIEKVRHGLFFNVGGNMPFYSLERLSDAQLGQILGYLEQFGLPHYAGM